MKTEELQAKGLTPEQIDFVMAENGRDLKRLQRENSELVADRDKWKKDAETAAETLKNFEGIDPQQIQSELASYKKRAEDAEADYQAKIAARDFDEALRAALEGVAFTSDAAKRAIVAEVKNAGLTVRDGKILGLNDLLGSLRKSDAAAFADEPQPARFTAPMSPRTPAKSTLDDMTLDERMRMKREQPEQYKRLKESK